MKGLSQEGGSNASLELKHSAVFVRQAGSVIIKVSICYPDRWIFFGIDKNSISKGNNFHNCNLVFLLQHGASPTITNNNVETCLIGFICGARADPKVLLALHDTCLDFFLLSRWRKTSSTASS